MSDSKPGPKPKPGGPLKARFTLKCNDEWAAWLTSFAESEQLSVAELVDVALAERAKRTKFAPPPPRT